MLALLLLGAPAFEMVVQSGHAAEVASVAYSPDGRLIASAAGDGTLKLWSLDGRLLRTIEIDAALTSLAFLPRGGALLVAADDGRVRAFGLDGEALYRLAAHEKAVRALAISRDGARLATGSEDGTIKLWSLPGAAPPKPLSVLGKDIAHYIHVESLAFLADGRLVAGAGNYFGRREHTLRIFAPDGKLLRTFEGNEVPNDVNFVAPSPDGKRFAVASGAVVYGKKDDSVKVFDAAGALVFAAQRDSGPVKAAAFAPDGRAILVGTGDGKLERWRADGTLASSTRVAGVGINSLAFAPDGKAVAIGASSFFGEGGTVVVAGADGRGARAFASHGGSVNAIAFHPSGRKLAAGIGFPGKTAALFSVTGRLEGRLEGHQWDVTAVAWSPDGALAATASRDKTVRLWREDGAEVAKLEGDGVFYGLAFSPDGKRLAAGAMDKVVRVWDVETRALQATLRGHTNNVYGVAFSPDGSVLASGSQDGTLRLWRVGSATTAFAVIEEKRTPVTGLSFSPAGLLAAAWRDKGVRVYDAERRVVRTHPGEHPVFGPDGTLATVVRGASPHLLLVDARGKEAARVPGIYSAVAFDPTGRLLAAGAFDGSVTLFRTGARLEAPVTLLAAEDQWIAYTPDGYFDASRGGSGLVAMVRGLESFRVDQFALARNRPDVLLERLGTGDAELLAHYRAQVKRRVRNAGIEEAGAELHVPEVRVLSSTTSGRFVSLRFGASDAQVPLARYTVYANGVPVVRKPLLGARAEVSERVELAPGVNELEVSATNARGAESIRASLSVRREGAAKRALWVLAFGVSKYQDPALELRYAGADARALAEAMTRARGFSAVHARAYTDGEVTVEKIRAAKAELAGARVEDVAVVFLAGHGVHADGADARYYFLTHEARLDALPDTAADFELIDELLDGIAPREKLLLLDTCESGDLDPTAIEEAAPRAKAKGLAGRVARAVRVKAGGAPPPPRAWLTEQDRYIYHDLVRRSGAVVLSSSRGGELSYESESLGHGLFTAQLLVALTTRAADANKDARVTPAELRRYLGATVAELSDHLQHPTIDRDNPLSPLALPVP